MTDRTEDSDNLHSIMQRLDRVDGRMEALTVQVTNLGASIMSRAEITAADDRRVSIESFTAHVAADEMRLARLENGPQRSLGWISLAVSIIIGGGGCLGGMVAILGTIFGIIWTIAQHH